MTSIWAQTMFVVVLLLSLNYFQFYSLARLALIGYVFTHSLIRIVSQMNNRTVSKLFLVLQYLPSFLCSNTHDLVYISKTLFQLYQYCFGKLINKQTQNFLYKTTTFQFN